MSGPCAACKFLRRKCAAGCIFAPYFPPDNPSRFSNVHKVFGASNVAKLLNELLPPLREDAVNSLSYEAEMRLKNPVYGCVAYISLLQLKIKEVELDLSFAKKELASYLGTPGYSSPFENGGIGTALGLGNPSATSSHAEVTQSTEARRLSAALQLSREPEMIRFDRDLDKATLGYNGNFTNGAMLALPPPSANQVPPHHQEFESVFATQQMSQLQFEGVESDQTRNCIGP